VSEAVKPENYVIEQMIFTCIRNGWLLVFPAFSPHPMLVCRYLIIYRPMLDTEVGISKTDRSVKMKSIQKHFQLIYEIGRYSKTNLSQDAQNSYYKLISACAPWIITCLVQSSKY
jgi:hypothetical protein